MIVQNAAICKKCDDFIFSASPHDFVQCKCGAIFVDGGQEYLRRGGELADIIECSWSIEDHIYKACADAVKYAIDTNRNERGIANAVLRVLRIHDRIIADNEQRIMAYNSDLDEVMVVEVNGTVNRYKKVLKTT